MMLWVTGNHAETNK